MDDYRSNAKDTPLVSVIIPTYRRAEMINRAINSVISQDYGLENLEVIVVDDNPESAERDDTLRQLGEYKGIEQVRVLHTTGGTGGGAARNYGCGQAGGKYLAFLDDDDEFLQGKISSQVAFMEAQELDMSWQDVSWYDETGRLVEHRHLDHCSDFSKEGLIRAHLERPLCPTSTYMIRRSLFNRTDGFGEFRTGQDWWLVIRCIEAGAKMGYQKGTFVRQYLHPGERLSLGENKIAGENARYEAGKAYYGILKKSEIRHVDFRHWAVLAFASARSGNWMPAMRYAARAFVTSPVDCLTEGIDFFTRGKRA